MLASSDEVASPAPRVPVIGLYHVPPVHREWSLHEVPQLGETAYLKDLAIGPVTPLFSPDGAFIAGESAVYRLADHVSLGRIAPEPDWRHACAIERTPSPILLQQLNRSATGKALCDGVIKGIVHKPDSQITAILCDQRDIYIIDTKNGAREKSLLIPAKQTIQEACWSTGGLAVLAAANDNDRDTSSVRPVFALYVWHDVNKPPETVTISPMYGADFLFEPLGRHLLALLKNHFETELRFIDLQTMRDAEPYRIYTGHGDGCDPEKQFTDAWLPGRFPILQTIETITGCSEDRVILHRIHTAASSWGISEQVVQSPPAADKHWRVLDDGVTVVEGLAKDSDIPKGISRGPELDTLVRARDGAIVQLTAQSAQTADGGFDCRTDCDSAWNRAASRIFRLGEKATQDAVIHGEQVMHRLYHPGLLQDFLTGKNVSLPLALQRPVGLPPLLAIQADTTPTGARQGLLLLRVTDRGGGVAGIRIWHGNQPLGNPIPIQDGYWVPWSLPDPALRCQTRITLSACNHDDTLCSKQVPVPGC